MIEPTDTTTYANANTTVNSTSAAQQNRVKTTDVVIVGAGAIGLSMCRVLKDSGLSVDLVETQPQTAIANPAADGREIAITHRTKAMMQRLEQWRELDTTHIHHLKRAEVFNGSSEFALGFDKPDSVAGKPIETLGYLIANHRIRKAAYASLASELANPTYLTTHFGQSVTAVKIPTVYRDHRDYAHRDNAYRDYDYAHGEAHHASQVSSQASLQSPAQPASSEVEALDIADTALNRQLAQVTLTNGQCIQAKLLLAADARTSFMRKALGISADMHDFGRTVLLFRCRHTVSNRQTAHEGFYYGKTLAVLPLGEYESSMVVTVENNKLTELQAMDNGRLAEEMEDWLNCQLGEMTVVSERHTYPLLSVHAERFYHTRSALIGDAAVGLHPVTAHGYNLGMESVDILSQGIYNALNRGGDIAHPKVLAQYHRTHSRKTRTLYHGTNAIVKLYTDDRPPAKIARNVALRLSNRLSPVKRLITKQLTG